MVPNQVQQLAIVSLSPGGSSCRKRSPTQAVANTSFQNGQKAVRKVSVALRALCGQRWRAESFLLPLNQPESEPANQQPLLIENISLSSLFSQYFSIDCCQLPSPSMLRSAHKSAERGQGCPVGLGSCSWRRLHPPPATCLFSLRSS